MLETLNTQASTLRDPTQPVIALEQVSLAFDDKVILRDISFALLPGHTKIILGASGSGKSTILKLILGLLKPDGGRVWVNGQRIDQFTEEQMMKVAETQMAYAEAAGLYKKMFSMWRTALGHG